MGFEALPARHLHIDLFLEQDGLAAKQLRNRFDQTALPHQGIESVMIGADVLDSGHDLSRTLDNAVLVIDRVPARHLGPGQDFVRPARNIVDGRGVKHPPRYEIAVLPEAVDWSLG